MLRAVTNRLIFNDYPIRGQTEKQTDKSEEEIGEAVE